MKNDIASLPILAAVLLIAGTSQPTNAQSLLSAKINLTNSSGGDNSQLSNDLSKIFENTQNTFSINNSKENVQIVRPTVATTKQQQIVNSLRTSSSKQPKIDSSSTPNTFNTSLGDLLVNIDEQLLLTELNTPPQDVETNPKTVPLDDLRNQPSLSDIKKELKIDPLDASLINPPITYSPSLLYTFSAFGANWGNLFLSGSAATAGRQRSRIDSYLGFGLGLGDAYNFVGSTISYNMQSIRNFGATNGVDVDLHRIVYGDSQTQVAMAVGVTNLIKIYNGGFSDKLETGYWGAITSYTFLRPDDPANNFPLALTLGAASGQYNETNIGIFGGVGLQIAPQLGIGVAWSGVSLDLGMSYVPIPTFPLTLSMEGIDLTNNTPGGPRFLLSIGLGYNFSPRGY